MSVHNILEKLLKMDQIKNLKRQNIDLQETFDKKINILSRECSGEVSHLLLELRIYSREQQRKVTESSILELNNNIKNEIHTSINLYESLIQNITNCESLHRISLNEKII